MFGRVFHFNYSITKFSNYSIFLSARKFDFAFGFGGDAVAGCGAISPGAHGLQDVTVAGESRAFQNERAVHVTIGSNNEADFHFLAVGRRRKKRIGRGQGLGRLNVFAGRA
jgi:hypothetical protein